MNKKILGRTLMFLLPLFILILALLLVAETKRNAPQMTTKTEKMPTLTPSKTPSRWATDSGVLEIESNLRAISEETESVDLKESSLFPPTLDMQIKL